MTTSSKRQRFASGSPAQSQIAQTLLAGSAEVGTMQLEVIPVSLVDLDPENPRSTGLNPRDPTAIDPKDPESSRKLALLADIQELAESIRINELQQPIKVFRNGIRYQLVFGERRFLATVLAGKEMIHAWVLHDRPRFIRRAQFVENEHRKDLTAWERIKHVQAVIGEYESYDEGTVDTARDLSELTGLANSTASNYLTLLRGPSDVLEALRSGVLNNLDRAVEIAREDDAAKRGLAIALYASGVTSEEVRKRMLAAQIRKREPERRTARGRPRTHVTLGTTMHTGVVRKILVALGYDDQDVNWSDLKSVSDAWKRLLKTLEKECDGQDHQ